MAVDAMLSAKSALDSRDAAQDDNEDKNQSAKTRGSEIESIDKEQQQQQQQQRRQSEAAKEDTSSATTAQHDKKMRHVDDKREEPREEALAQECERLLRNAKRQVKQMMEEAVTRKCIHEESSSIISLCVAVDACLSHQLKRRALGLFKTNSSTALVQKVAKIYPAAAEIMQMVDAEERRQQEALKQQLQQQQQQQQQADGGGSALGRQSLPRSPLKQQLQQQVVSSNYGAVHKRNIWIKCALLERKLVPIVEFLADNAHKYYERSALMASCVSAQLLCSLLAGVSALEFSRSKTSDSYQFDEPSADELLKRHKLSNPIACLCTATNNNSAANYRSPQHAQQHIARSWSSSLARNDSPRASPPPRPSCSAAHPLARAATDTTAGRVRRVRTSSASQTTTMTTTTSAQSTHSDDCAPNSEDEPAVARAGGGGVGGVVRERRRRPLALRTNVKTSALVTECHHYSCQEISEHQQTRGYSFKSLSDTTAMAAAAAESRDNSAEPRALLSATSAETAPDHHHQHQAAARRRQWPAWSPRMLHETLHQNSRSSLLYAKNNVMLETQAHGTVAGYLSLHQSGPSSCPHDLILKWIPNQLINGGQQSVRAAQPAQAVAAGATCAAQDSGGTCERAPAGVGDCERAHASSSASSIGGAYLDLVINLSVSRIVLLQCHFNGGPLTSSGSTTASNNDEEPPPPSPPPPPMAPTKAPDEMKNSSLADIEETLVLVEADGVQRAPFRFPMGGLRWFLACLESGLRPDKLLEPAIGLAGDESPRPADETRENPLPQPDPLQMLYLLGSAEHSCECPPEAASVDQGTTSRLDVLLSRLPSLKRASAKATATSDQQQEASGGAASSDASRVTSPSPSSVDDGRQRPAQRSQVARSIDYVYRIVPAQQVEWPIATPLPRQQRRSVQAVSQQVAMSPGGTGGSLGDDNGKPKSFRWSLSRLTRFSSSSRTGSSSVSSSGCASSSGTLEEATPVSAEACAAASSQASTKPLSAPGALRSNLTTSLTSLLYGSGSLWSNGTSVAGNSVGEQPASLSALLTTDEQQQQRQQQRSLAMRRDSSSELIRIEAKLSDLKKSSTEELAALRDQSVASLCESMRKQILARAFYGWLAYCRRMKIIRTHLGGLISEERLRSGQSEAGEDGEEAEEGEEMDDNLLLLLASPGRLGAHASAHGLTRQRWLELMSDESRRALGERKLRKRVCALVYLGGVADDQLRREVWPYLLGHYRFCDSSETRARHDKLRREAYESSWREWVQIERVIRQRDSEILAENMAKAARRQLQLAAANGSSQAEPAAATAAAADLNAGTSVAKHGEAERAPSGQESELDAQTDNGSLLLETDGEEEARTPAAGCDPGDEAGDEKGQACAGDSRAPEAVSAIRAAGARPTKVAARATKRRRGSRRRFRLESTGSLGSDASVTDQFGNNIHRIDKDVQRCDRNFWFFKDQINLDKLRNIMCNYVWQHLDVGYVQGMCDLAAPILVIFRDDELMAYECFRQLMKRMVANFPHGTAMDKHFEHLKYLMQVLDPKLFEVLQNNGDYTHFYFCYRWLLLDFKRELAYDDVYRVWETIWSARFLISEHFVIFLALAMVRFYRDIIIENNMDFTDTIKFFNEMAERHDAGKIIALAQDCVLELESLIKA